MATDTKRLRRLSNLAREDTQNTLEGGGSGVFSWLVLAGQTIPPWWSRSRDLELRKFWKNSDHLSGALYNFGAKMTAIPFHIEARDMSIRDHVREADIFTALLLSGSELGQGWTALYDKFIQDLVGTDNGGFSEVLGDGPVDGPIIGPAQGLVHRDSARCNRTNNPIYPVVYYHVDGQRYKMHFSRVIMLSQMPSPDALMWGVGFCACSRAVATAQHLIDIATYENEKLGSRPHRQIIVAQRIGTKEIEEAFRLASERMDNEGLARFSRNVVIASKTQPIDLKTIDLNSVPDGFDKNTDITLGMFCLALALGVDARELWPGVTPGATKADAMLQSMKSRVRGPGQIINQVEGQFNLKVLPPYLKMVFDMQDDQEDAQVADIRGKRAETRSAEVMASTISVRVAREQALRDGDITKAQFEMMELEDGRLEDGSNVLDLFYSDDPDIKKYLGKFASDTENEALVKTTMEDCIRVLMNSQVPDDRKVARQCLAALRKRYGENEPIMAAESEDEVDTDVTANTPTTTRPTNPVTGRPKTPAARNPDHPDDDVEVKEATPVPDTTISGMVTAAVKKWNKRMGSTYRRMLGE